jgi:murein DD-endopeptidase MepM/ murein hydrolase activator NlpD
LGLLVCSFISSPYGPRKLQGHRRSIHYGVDIAADTGTPILAADRGVIVKVAHHFWDTDG